MSQNEERWNLRLVAHSQLNGFGNCGEGLALRQVPDGRRILYIAHLSAPKDFSVVDVTDPSKPRVVVQTELPHGKVRSNSLAVVGDILLVAYQVATPGLEPAGMGIYDISNIERPRRLGFFDASGPYSRGVHCLWFVDGRYAHLSTGMPDFVPTNPKDDQLYVIVDMANPANPSEVGRWWLPGIRQGDNVPPPTRHPRFDEGFRPHNINVYPERPNRAYIGYIDAGVVILDISDMSQPGMISRLDYHPPFPGMTHTAVPLFKRDLLIVTDEALLPNCADWPKLIRVIDIREERNPVILSSFPLPPRDEFCQRGGRFGAHNIHENEPSSTSFVSSSLVFGAFFNAGVRVYDIADPFRPEEVGYYIPPAPKGCPSIQINDVYVDERGLVYAVDRVKGGLYILEMEF